MRNAYIVFSKIQAVKRVVLSSLHTQHQAVFFCVLPRYRALQERRHLEKHRRLQDGQC